MTLAKNREQTAGNITSTLQARLEGARLPLPLNKVATKEPKVTPSRMGWVTPIASQQANPHSMQIIKYETTKGAKPLIKCQKYRKY